MNAPNDPADPPDPPDSSDSTDLHDVVEELTALDEEAVALEAEIEAELTGRREWEGDSQ